MTRDDPTYALNYSELATLCVRDGLALVRTWLCICGAATEVDCVEILLLAIEPPCTGCARPLPWRKTTDA